MIPMWFWGPPSSPKHEQPPWVQGASAPTHPLTPSRVLHGWQEEEGGCLPTLLSPKSHAAGSQILLLAEGGGKQGSSCALQSGEMVWGGARRAQDRRNAKAAAQGSGVSLLGLAPGT